MNPLIIVHVYILFIAALSVLLILYPDQVLPMELPVTTVFLGAYMFSVCMVASVGLLALGVVWEPHVKPRLFTWLTNHGAIRMPRSDMLRRDFSSQKMRSSNGKINHSHGDSAGRRTVAKRFMSDFALGAGLTPFQVQQSANDQKHGVGGNRTFFWSKDIGMDCRYGTPSGSDLVLLTDVDYYINMPWFLAWTSLPTMIYTFVPSSLACTKGEASHTFHKDNTVEQRVSGGAAYRHKLWNYGSDNCVATWRVWGIPLITTTYLVERRNVDDDHQIIFFVPTGRFWGPFAWLADQLEGFRVERLEVVDGEYTRMLVQDRKGLMMCTGLAGQYVAAKVPVEQDDGVCMAAKLMKNDITPPTVQTYTGSGLDKRGAAAVICGYHREYAGFKTPCVYPVDYAIKPYTYKTEEFFEHAKAMLTGFMSPIVDECYVPTDCVENEQVGLDERVTKILTDVEMPDAYRDYVNEFITLLVPEPHKLVPTDMDEVYDRQNRPTQRHLIDEGAFYGPDMEKKRAVDSFVKAEAYQEPKPPRNISTINPRDKIDYSCFVYAAAELMKQTKWYAFGKTPRDIAARVAEVCQLAKKHGVNSDLSRFDGRLAEAFRLLERAFLLRAFAEDYAEQIADLHKSQFGLRGRGRHGTQYNTGFSRLSGSPETALFNSLANAFMVFVTLRRCGNTAENAWKRLGIYGGDDGLTADLDVAKYVETAKSLGMVTTTESVKKGEFGVKFLARVYSESVWDGSLDSCCDMLRQLAKLHATPNLPPTVSPAQKLVEKARGYYLSDRNTPVIGELAVKVMELSTQVYKEGYVCVVEDAGGRAKEQSGTMVEIAAQQILDTYTAKQLRNYASLAPADEQYPNEDSGWMEHALAESIPTFDFALFRSALNDATSLQDLLSLPVCAEPKEPRSSIPVVVAAQIVQVDAPPPVAEEKPVESKTLADAGKAPPSVPPRASSRPPPRPPRDPKRADKSEPGPSAKPADPHDKHNWDNRSECYACHPELRRHERLGRKEKKPASPEVRTDDPAKTCDSAAAASTKPRTTTPRSTTGRKWSEVVVRPRGKTPARPGKDPGAKH